MPAKRNRCRLFFFFLNSFWNSKLYISSNELNELLKQFLKSYIFIFSIYSDGHNEWRKEVQLRLGAGLESAVDGCHDYWKFYPCCKLFSYREKISCEPIKQFFKIEKCFSLRTWNGAEHTDSRYISVMGAQLNTQEPIGMSSRFILKHCLVHHAYIDTAD